ncbi:MAG: dihydrolipoyl dehydrogenase [Halanaerobium sp.]|nr:dihydrolipoyl dehydrogenase [Halanaerobium sp.]
MEYDILILGGGPGGYVAALRAATLGAKVGLIEKEALGGTCLNRGCIPTKTLLNTVHILETIKKAPALGIEVEGSPEIDVEKLRERKEGVVARLRSGVENLLQARKVDIIQGVGQVLNKNEILVDERNLMADKLILATGSVPARLPIEGFAEGRENGLVITSREALELKEIPEKMVIIGGGVVGVEMAAIYAGLGSEVTVVEQLPGLVPGFSKDIGMTLEENLNRNGIKVYTGAGVTALEENIVMVETDEGDLSFECDKVLEAVGRIPNLHGIGKLPLKMNGRAIWTDDYCQTSIPGVYAIGDLNGKALLAHVAMEEGIVAAENIAGARRKMSYLAVPGCIYTRPEIAVVGLSEEVAREKGYEVVVGRSSLTSNGKALAGGENTGWVKVIAEKEFGQVIGMEIVASKATEMIMEGVLARKMEMTADELEECIHPHPGLSEAIMEAVLSLQGKPLHG